MPDPPAGYRPVTKGGASKLVIKRIAKKGPAARLMAARKRTLIKAHYYGVPERDLAKLPGVHRTFLYTYLERYIVGEQR